MTAREEELHEYLVKKKLKVLETIKPICEAFGIKDYDYEIESNRERLRIYDTKIGCSCNSIDGVVDELVGYIFVCRFRERPLGAFKVQTFVKIKEYWIK
ncbi:MAG: hypothetical protein ABTA16_16995 [Niallia sp.]